MATVELRYDPKDSAWFTTNATMVLKAGEPAYHSVTGKFKLGDGVTQLQNLEFLNNESQLITATVVNKTGVNLLASNYQVVKVSTAQGQRLAVDFAQANNDNNSADTIGLVRENITNNLSGDITILGQITEINTTGSLQGETWVDGDVLYLSPTTAGRATNIKPTGLVGHLVVLGYVEYAHAIHGKIFVKINNGFELDELHNVYINPSTLANNDVLTYESATGLWKNKISSSNILSQLTVSGNRRPSKFNYGDSVTTTHAAGRYLCFKVTPAVSFQCVGLSCIINTASATGNFRIGLYTNNGIKPGNLIEETGSLPTATTGLKEGIINQLIDKNTSYWIVVQVSDAVMSLPYLRQTENDIIDPTTGLVYCAGFSVGTYGSLPANFSAITLTYGRPINAYCVDVLMKVQ